MKITEHCPARQNDLQMNNGAYDAFECAKWNERSGCRKFSSGGIVRAHRNGSSDGPSRSEGALEHLDGSPAGVRFLERPG